MIGGVSVTSRPMPKMKRLTAYDEQRQPHDHLEGARPQQQPHAGAGQHADRQRVARFPSARTSPAVGVRCAAGATTGARARPASAPSRRRPACTRRGRTAARSTGAGHRAAAGGSAMCEARQERRAGEPGDAARRRPRRAGRGRSTASGWMRSRDSTHMRATDHVLHDDRRRHHEAADEAAARRVVAAQQEVRETSTGHRQQQARRAPPECAGSPSATRRSDSSASRAASSRCAWAAARLSGAGRKRRSSAYTVSATMPTTVISPSVSKPRKSTRITLTTLRPPACCQRVARGSRAPARSADGRVSHGKGERRPSRRRRRRRTRRMSRARRARARSVRRRSASSTRAGAAASAGRAGSAPVVTTSTAICVSARSGAENQAKVRQVTSPAPPTMISAARR